ncbi:MAG: hypothetical protein FWD65_03575 [Coriobacteriia bacterium]|nr:hypothetical protein [Coriobacteriia bacterium]
MDKQVDRKALEAEARQLIAEGQVKQAGKLIAETLDDTDEAMALGFRLAHERELDLVSAPSPDQSKQRRRKTLWVIFGALPLSALALFVRTRLLPAANRWDTARHTNKSPLTLIVGMATLLVVTFLWLPITSTKRGKTPESTQVRRAVYWAIITLAAFIAITFVDVLIWKSHPQYPKPWIYF